MRAYLLRFRLTLAALAVSSFAGFVLGQTPAAGPVDGAPGLTVRQIHPRTVSPVFPLNARSAARQTLEFRSPQEMTQADRELAQANEVEIARRAALQGFAMDRDGAGNWGYEQAVCPVFPGHLILEYSRGDSAGDATMFSVVIPRGEGHVRVIPVRRRGYSLWTPASSNAITINDFNHMVVESHEGLAPDWLTLGLCYAALAGGHVRAALVAQKPADETWPLLDPAMLTVMAKGGAEVHFTDAGAKARPKDWALEFDRKGRLLKVQHPASRTLVERPTAGAPVDVETPKN
jgi:hypothetical protein